MTEPRRSYDDPCGLARALDVVGERWALLIVRELLFGPKRFADLSRGLPGMSQNVLAQRLRELEQATVVRRRTLGPPASARVYELTPRGAALEPVLLALAAWGSGVPLNQESAAELSVAALMLALKTTFDPRPASGVGACVELRVGDDHFHAEIRSGQFQVARGPTNQPDAILESDVATLRGVFFGGRPLADAIRRGDLRLDGDRRAAAQFAGCFPRPLPAVHAD